MGRRAAIAIAGSLSLLSAIPARAAGDHADAFAAILQLEDRRSLGGTLLTGYLTSRHPLDVRVRAVLALGRIGSPTATPYHLLAATTDSNPSLRRMAAFALGEMDDVKASPLLATMLKDSDAQVRALAAEALGKLKDPACVADLAGRLDDADPETAGMALLALWKIDLGPARPEIIRRAAEIYRKSRGDLRQRAVYFMMRAAMGSPDAGDTEEALLEQSRDADALTRSFAARGLAAIETPGSTASLLSLAADADWRVRVNALNGLRARPHDTVPDAVTDSNTSVGLAGLAALESCTAGKAGELLSAALADLRPRFREVAAVALAARDKRAALAKLRPLASDDVWSVRARLAEALGGIGDPDVEPILLRLASDHDARVRPVAVTALSKLATPAASSGVAAALADPDPYVRSAALEVTADTQALADGYDRGRADTPADARLSALASLAKLKTDAARAAVEKGLEDGDYIVRRRAAELLKEAWGQDSFAKVGEAAPRLDNAGYLEAVRRARRRVTATFDTQAGTIVVQLLAAEAPLTVDNFIRLARGGALDSTVFHRVVPNFVIQDGDPRGDGNGGPAWTIRCEINMRRYGAGAVGMALSGKDTGGSQYFMTHSPQPHLDGGYTIFGQVISGQEAVDRMVQGDSIRRVTISEKE